MCSWFLLMVMARSVVGEIGVTNHVPQIGVYPLLVALHECRECQVIASGGAVNQAHFIRRSDVGYSHGFSSRSSTMIVPPTNHSLFLQRAANKKPDGNRIWRRTRSDVEWSTDVAVDVMVRFAAR